MAPKTRPAQGDQTDLERMNCEQKGCEKVAAYRYTWPGVDETVVCAEHANVAQNIARALGMHLQVHDL